MSPCREVGWKKLNCHAWHICDLSMFNFTIYSPGNKYTGYPPKITVLRIMEIVVILKRKCLQIQNLRKKNHTMHMRVRMGCMVIYCQVKEARVCSVVSITCSRIESDKLMVQKLLSI